MSSRSRASLLLLAALALAGCDRETRDFHSAALRTGEPAAAFGGNAYHLAQGRGPYPWMTSAAGHAPGGGGMGPPLRDDEWRYGGSMQEMVSTILDGRPNGMPAFRGRITEDQAWQLATYVRSLSARTRQDILSGRADEPANVEPPVLDERKPVRPVTAKQDDATEE